MSIVKQSLVGASGQGGGYTINNSLRFRSSASAYLSRTPASAGNRRTWTFSFWSKIGTLTTYRRVFSTVAGGSQFYFRLDNNDQFTIESAGTVLLNSTSVYRDPSAWYHFLIVLDTTQSTASNRLKVYINGTQVTAFDTTNYPSQNSDHQWNNNVAHYISGHGSGEYYDGYVTEANFIDGQALTADDFGEFDEDTGVWKPKRYTGTYGTNGFYLNGVGVTDRSGNGNNWTNNNLNLSTSTATTYDQMKDTPSLVDENAGNFCTLSPISKHASSSTTNANLTGTTTTASDQMILSTFAVSSGKWYWEVVSSAQASAGCMVGVRASYLGFAGSLLSETDGYAYYPNGSKYSGAGGAAYGASWTNGDVIGIALDLDSGTIVFYKNNVSQGTAFTGINGTYTPGVSNGGVTSSSTFDINFGQRPFAYTPPTGFLKLNTFNLPDSTIEKGSDYFNTVLWTGNGSNPQSIGGLNFQPDMVWAKARNAGTSHVLTDAVRGATKTIYPDTTLAEATASLLTAFNSDGFDVSGGLNAASRTLVGWSWKANGSGVSNTVGTIPSTVSANTTSGFSIVTYSANGSTGTIGHGLSSAPELIIVKKRNAAERWTVYHQDTSNAYIYLNETFAAETANANLRFGNNSSVVAPTSSVFTVGNSNDVNGSSGTYVAYCFAEVEGYSAFGSYTGNGSTDGPFVYTGFRPAWIMIKRTDTTGNWQIQDSSRTPFNWTCNALFADSAGAENTSALASTYGRDYLSNGFKIRSSHTSHNTNGGTYIYMAFAENPFKNANAR